jgi:hypothetical protein
MTAKRRLRALQRLVHIADLLYRQEAAAVGRARRHRDDLAASAARAHGELDRDISVSGAWRAHAVRRAARLRRDVADADAHLDRQMRAATDALAQREGLEAKRQSMLAQTRAETVAREFADILEVITRGSPASFE